jgi:hypothetical protein
MLLRPWYHMAPLNVGRQLRIDADTSGGLGMTRFQQKHFLYHGFVQGILANPYPLARDGWTQRIVNPPGGKSR